LLINIISKKIRKNLEDKTMKVTHFDEPIAILDKLSTGDILMRTSEMSFLCGLLKQYRPKKIVEIGIADGGTTAVILNCLNMLDLCNTMYSIDIAGKSHSDSSKKIGYLAEECKELIQYKYEHSINVGILPNYIEKIGNDIDFVIIDTIHMLPGEVLDFITILPYLKENAVVVLHDTTLNHEGAPWGWEKDATRVIYSSTVGERITSEQYGHDINIGAIQITKDTIKYVENLFQSLLLTWKYELDENHRLDYRRIFEKFYEKKYLDIYDLACSKNKNTYPRMRAEYANGMNNAFDYAKKFKGKNFYLYGAGQIAEKFAKILKANNISVCGYIVSDGKEKKDDSVSYLHEIDRENENTAICVATCVVYQKEIDAVIQDKKNLYFLDEKVVSFLEKV